MTSSQLPARTVEPAVYTVDEIAVLLGVSKATVYTMAGNGQLPSKRVGRRYIFPKVAIHSWLEDSDSTGPSRG